MSWQETAGFCGLEISCREFGFRIRPKIPRISMKTKIKRRTVIMRKIKNCIIKNSSLIPHLSYLKRKTLCRFTLIELLVVIAIIAILLRSKRLFFLLFSAYFAFSRFDEKKLNTQIPNVTSDMFF